MMKIKRMFAGLLVLIMFMLSLPCIAATETIINPVTCENDIVSVSGVVPTPKSRVYIEIVRKDEQILDEENVYLSKIITAGETGEFSLKCKMPEKDRKNTERSVDGYFTLYVITAGEEDKTLDFSYVTPESREAFFDNLNKAKASGLKEFLNDENNKVYFDLYNILIDEYYTNSDEKKNILCKNLENKDGNFTKDNISKINDAIITSRLNSIGDVSKVKDIIESDYIYSRLELSYGEETYETIATIKKEWFYEVVLQNSKLNKFTEISQLNDVFCEAMILYEINNTHYSTLFEVLNGNKTELGLENSDVYRTISAMTAEKQKKVMQELKTLSNSVSGVDELLNLLEKAYNNYIAHQQGNSKPSGSSGGSGSGSGSGSGKKNNNVLAAGSIYQSKAEEDSKISTGKEYFNDLAGYDWAKEAINGLADAKIVSGDGNGNFNPEKNVTRAEFVTMLMNTIDMVNEQASCEFIDVEKSSWCYKYVASAFEQGIASGVSEDIFGKDLDITRQEAAVFLHRAAVRIYLPLDNGPAEAFRDESDIGEWAVRSVNLMKAAGLINGVGDGKFAPYGVTTRAQAAKMIYGLYELA